jgi:glycosyltransferase involved in cell wall biosynthesis
LFSTPMCPSMARAIRSSGAGVIHLHLPNPAAILAYLVSGSSARLIVSYHSDIVRQKILGTMFEPLLHMALRRSTAIIASAPQNVTSSPVLARYRDRCHIIPYGIDVQQFENCDRAQVDRIRQQYGDRLILSVGRLVYYKGFEYLIRAMAHVRGSLLIIGSGPLQSKLERLILHLNLSGKVFLAGRVAGTLVNYYHAARTFVLPSVARSEAFGIVQIEAMAAGTPVINTQLDSGVPFVSLHETTGLTVPPADSEALAGAINRLLDDPELCHRFGQNARARAQTKFSLAAMTAKTLVLYEPAEIRND